MWGKERKTIIREQKKKMKQEEKKRKRKKISKEEGRGNSASAPLVAKQENFKR